MNPGGHSFDWSAFVKGLDGGIKRYNLTDLFRHQANLVEYLRAIGYQASDFADGLTAAGVGVSRAHVMNRLFPAARRSPHLNREEVGQRLFERLSTGWEALDDGQAKPAREEGPAIVDPTREKEPKAAAVKPKAAPPARPLTQDRSPEPMPNRAKKGLSTPAEDGPMGRLVAGELLTPAEIDDLPLSDSMKNLLEVFSKKRMAISLERLYEEALFVKALRPVVDPVAKEGDPRFPNLPALLEARRGGATTWAEAMAILRAEHRPA